MAVARILGDGTRQRTRAFAHLRSHHLFRDRFGRLGKGKVEALVKTARRKFTVPIPRVPELDALNERLTARCLERLGALEQDGAVSALLADLDALRDLPAAPFEACEHMPCQVSSTALMRYRLADYSAPAAHAHKKLTIKGYVDRVEIALGAEIVGRDRRSYVRGDVVYDPLRYLSLLERKPGTLEQAAPLRGWKLDPASDALRRLLEARFGPRGKRHIVTSNPPFQEWTSVFASERLTGALVDRITHHVHMLEMNGESYRLKRSCFGRRTPKRDVEPPRTGALSGLPPRAHRPSHARALPWTTETS